jgi:hypothetical protein
MIPHSSKLTMVDQLLQQLSIKLLIQQMILKTCINPVTALHLIGKPPCASFNIPFTAGYLF